MPLISFARARFIDITPAIKQRRPEQLLLLNVIVVRPEAEARESLTMLALVFRESLDQSPQGLMDVKTIAIAPVVFGEEVR